MSKNTDKRKSKLVGFPKYDPMLDLENTTNRILRDFDKKLDALFKPYIDQIVIKGN